MFSPYPYEKSSFTGEWFSSVGLDYFGIEQTLLPDKLTPMTADQVASAMSSAFKMYTGKKPSPAVLNLMLAQWALETGNGKSIHNYNLGNAKRSSADKYYQFFRCSEIINGQEVFFDPPSPQCAFAAFKTPAEGALAYIKVLAKKPHWWAGLLSGNVNTFNSALSTAPKYYTASPSLYLSALQNRAAYYTSAAKKYGSTFGNQLASAVVGISLGLLGLYYTPAAVKYTKKRVKKLGLI